MHLALFGEERKAADRENVPLRLSRLGLPSSLFVLILAGLEKKSRLNNV